MAPSSDSSKQEPKDRPLPPLDGDDASAAEASTHAAPPQDRPSETQPPVPARTKGGRLIRPTANKDYVYY